MENPFKTSACAFLSSPRKILFLRFHILGQDRPISSNSLYLRLHSDATEQIPQIAESLSICLGYQELFSEKLLSPLDSLAISHFETLPISDTIPPSKALERKEADMTQMKAGQWRQTRVSGRPLLQNTIEERAQRNVPKPVEEPALKKRYECRPGCHCSCHIKHDFSSPWIMNSLLGELCIHWRSQKPEVRCNCSGHTGLAVIYRFPQFLLQRYISMILQSTYNDGPELILRVPRILPWSHLLWRYSVCGDLQAIKKMYADRTASPYDVDPAGRNALLYASKQQSGKVAQFLLDQGNDSNQLDNLGRPPSEFLLKRSFGGMFGEHGEDIMRRILKDDSSFDEFGFKTLHQIILGIIPKSLGTVLEATTDSINMPDSIGRTALFWAVIRDNADHVRTLLDYGADPNAKDVRGYTPIDFVRGPAVCKLLLDKGAENNINPKNWYHSSLHEQVIESGSAEVMALFAAKGYPIDIKDHDNETPLLNAIYAGHTAVVKLLIDLGADVNNANLSSRDTALHFAASFDRPQILKMLLDKRADYTVLNCNGRNLAHCAARAGSTDLVKVMTGANLVGLDLALKDNDGKTPGDYMNERIVMTDLEVGVHEAWEELMASLSLPPPVYVEVDVERKGGVVVEEVLEIDGLDLMPECVKVPGAFPIETVTEIGVFAA